MIEFGKTFLFKVNIVPESGSYRNWEKRRKPIYVVSTDSKAAIEYASRFMKGGQKVKSVNKLGEQFGGNFFDGEYK
jgi:hypothetical protein